MRLSHVFLTIAVALLGTSEALSTTTETNEGKILKVASSDGPRSHRMLKTHHKAFEDDEDDENDEEERLLWNLKYKFWLKTGEDPMSIYKKLGLSGLGQKAYLHPNFKHYIKFSEKWRNKY